MLEWKEWEERQRTRKGIDEYDEVAMWVYPRYQAALRSFSPRIRIS